MLILDDIWRYEDAKVFHLGGPRCRLLLTTRQAEVANKLGTEIQAIPPMTQDDAINLLEAWARGHLADADRAMKEQVVKRLGYLPLAIKLAGPQLTHQSPQKWLHTFDVRKLKFHRIETTHDSLELAFDLSLEMLHDEERKLYLNLALFKEDEAIPQVAIEHLWQGLSGLSAEENTDVLVGLADQALLELSSDGTVKEVRLHDLLHDLIKIRLGEDGLIEAHRALLKAYRNACRGSGWHTAKDDGYLYNHLAYHLYAAGEEQELKRLFADQSWLHVRIPQHAYTYDGYLADLSLALEYASSRTRRQIEADQEPESFAECIRYTLIHGSINSIAGNHVPELIARAVQVGAWSSDQAMSMATNIPQAEQRANAYLLLLETEQLSKKHQETAQRAILEYTNTTPDDEAKSRMLARLIPLLTEELLEQALAVAGTLTGRLAYAKMAIMLAPRLAGQQRIKVLKSALDAIFSASDDMSRRDLFDTLVPQLTDELLVSALNTTLEGTRGLDRVDLLAALAPRLRGNLLEQAFETVMIMPEAWERAQCLAALAPQLTETLLKRALQVTLAIEDERARARMIAALSPRLRGVFLHQALDDVLTISDERARAMALAALAARCNFTGESLERIRQAALNLLEKGLSWPAVHLARQLDNEKRVHMLQKILESMPIMTYQWEKPEVLKAVTSLLSDELLKQALVVTLNEIDNEIRPYMLGVLAPQLRNGLLQEALEATLQEKDEKIYPYMFETLASQLTKAQLELVFQTVLKMQDKDSQLRALERLLPNLRNKQRDQALMHALELILSIEDERWQVGAFIELAPQLTGESLQRALAAIENIKYAWMRTHMFAALVPQLTDEPLKEALRSALDMRGEEAYRRALIILVPRLEDKQRSQTLTHVLELTLAVTDAQERANLLMQLIPHLEDEQRHEAIHKVYETAKNETAKVFPSQWFQAQLLVALIPYLSGEDRDEAIASAWRIALELFNENLLMQVLSPLVPYLDDQYLRQAYQVASGMMDKRARTQLYVVLAPRLSHEQRDQIFSAVLEDILAEDDEPLRIRLLAMLAPQLTGVQRIQALAHTLETAQLITDEQVLAEALVMVIPLLTGKQEQWALQAVLTISNQWVLSAALIRMAPQLNGKAQEQAIQAALAIKDEWLRANALAAFLPVVSNQSLLLKLIRQAIVNILAFLQKQPLQEILQYFLTNNILSPPVLSHNILGTIRSYVIEIYQEWHWQ